MSLKIESQNQSAPWAVALESAREASQLDERLDQAITRARDYLLSLQHPDGHWCSELMVDTTLVANKIAIMHFLGRVDETWQRKGVNYIRRHQLPDGSWNIFLNGPGELDATVKAYLACKLAGVSIDEHFMEKARRFILDHGGIAAMNTFSRFYLALLGQIPWEKIPALMPELILLPTWLPISLYQMSSWTRCMVVPMTIIYAHKPVSNVPLASLDELYLVPRAQTRFELLKSRGFLSWRNIWLMVDGVMRKIESTALLPLRRLALKRATKWMLEHHNDQHTEGLGAIFPAMLNTLIALRVLGYDWEHPAVKKAERVLHDLEIEEEDTVRIRPCFSPVWDTAIAVIALHEAGLPSNHSALQQATRWLLAQEVTKEICSRGDWRVRNPGVEPSGWAFEFANAYNPDVDDTAMVLLALDRVELDCSDPRNGYHAKDVTMERALQWMLSFQCRDGGWGSFDKDCTLKILDEVPFADHNAMLDPTCADITARILELLGARKFPRRHPCITSAIEYLRRTQEADGSWFGRWGVNYVYGTWQGLRGLAAIGEDMSQAWIQKGFHWLEFHQNDDGGWGERCDTYDDSKRRGEGPSTPSQTAWGLMGLLACFQNTFAAGIRSELDRPSLLRAMQFFIDRQKPDGSWDEEETTGTGFPGVFYLKYDYYRLYFPLLALAEYRKWRRQLRTVVPGTQSSRASR